MPTICYESTSNGSLPHASYICFIERRPTVLIEHQFTATVRLLSAPESILGVFSGHRDQLRDMIQQRTDNTTQRAEVNFIVIFCSSQMIHRADMLPGLWDKWRYIFLNAPFNVKAAITRPLCGTPDAPQNEEAHHPSKRINQWREQIKKERCEKKPSPKVPEIPTPISRSMRLIHYWAEHIERVDSVTLSPTPPPAPQLCRIHSTSALRFLESEAVKRPDKPDTDLDNRRLIGRLGS